MKKITLSKKKFLKLLVILMIFLPWVVSCSQEFLYQMNMVFLSIIAVQSLNILFEYLGVVSIGQAALMGVGAYVMASFSLLLGSSHWLFLNGWFIFIVVAAVLVSIISMGISFVCAKLNGLYFLVATLVFQISFEWLIGGQMSIFEYGDMVNFERIHFFGINLGREYFGGMWFSLLVVLNAAIFYSLKNFEFSKYHRFFLATKENPAAVPALGLSLTKARIMAFGLSGFYLGLAGACKALVNRGVTLDSYKVIFSTEQVSMLFMGGAGYPAGPIVGSVSLEIINTLTEVVSRFFLSGHQVSPGVAMGFRPILFGACIVVLLKFFQGGIVGSMNKARISKVKKK